MGVLSSSTQDNHDALLGIAAVVCVVVGMGRPPLIPDRIWRFLCWSAAIELGLWIWDPSDRAHWFLGICAPIALGALFIVEARWETRGEHAGASSGEAIALTREGADLRARIGGDEFKLNIDARAWGGRVRRFIEIHAFARLPEYDALDDLPDAAHDYIEPPSRLIPTFVDSRLKVISEVAAGDTSARPLVREELTRLYRRGVEIRSQMRATQPPGGGVIVRVPTDGSSSIEDDYGFRVWEREVCAYLRKELPHQSEHFCAERAGDLPKIGGTITDTSKPTDEIDEDIAELGRIINALP